MTMRKSGKRRWNQELILSIIVSRYKAGKKLNSNYAQNRLKPIYSAACSYFGGWKQAVEAAGIKYDSVKIVDPICRVWSKDKIIKIIRDRYRRNLPINSSYAQTRMARLYWATYKHFGGWGQAIEAAGFHYAEVRLIRAFRCWTKRNISKSINERFEAGLSLNGYTVYREDSGLYIAARRYFGSWKKALRFAGFNPGMIPHPNRIWTKDLVCEQILTLHRQGMSLDGTSLKQKGHIRLFAAGRKVFGSWRKAILCSGFKYASVRKVKKGWWTPKRVVYSIQRLEKAGVSLSLKNIRLYRRGIISAACQHFGSWSQAVEAAGIDYEKHCKVWSSKAWIRKLTPDDVKRIDEQALEMAKVSRRG